MSKKIILLLISFIGISGTFFWFYQPSASYAFRQVKAVAPTKDNLLLAIDNHIRHSKRLFISGAFIPIIPPFGRFSPKIRGGGDWSG